VGAVRIAFHDDARADVQIAPGIRLARGLEVGALHRLAVGVRQRSDEDWHVATNRFGLAQRRAVQAARQHHQFLALDVPSRRELFAQAVVGGMRDGGLREVTAPEAVVPRRPQRQRLGAEAFLGSLVDVEARDLELWHGALSA
jgi:hypothetical protein